MVFSQQQWFPKCSFKKSKSARGDPSCLVDLRPFPPCLKSYAVGTCGKIWKEMCLSWKIWQRHHISSTRPLWKSCNTLCILLEWLRRLWGCLALPSPSKTCWNSDLDHNICALSGGFGPAFACGSCSSCPDQTKMVEEMAHNTWAPWSMCTVTSGFISSCIWIKPDYLFFISMSTLDIAWLLTVRSNGLGLLDTSSRAGKNCCTWIFYYGCSVVFFILCFWKGLSAEFPSLDVWIGVRMRMYRWSLLCLPSACSVVWGQ